MKRGDLKTRFFSRCGTVLLCMAMMMAQLCIGSVSAESEETGATKIFYRDYEDYAPVTNSAAGASVIANSDNTYGTLVGDDPSGWFDNSTVKIAGKNGYGVNFSQKNYEGGSISKSANWDNLDLGQTYTSGQLYIAFDIQLKDLSDDAGNTETISIWLKDENKTEHTAFVIHKPEDGKCQIAKAIDENTWNGDLTESYLDAEKTYKIEIVCDIANQTYTYYVNGVQVSSKTTTRTSTAIKYMKLKLSNMINYFDNFTIMHYADSTAANAAMSATAAAYTGKSTIALRLTDSLYGAGVVLNDTNMKKITLKKGEESVPVTVTGGDSDGDYIISISGEKLEDTEYTIDLSDAEDTIGRKYTAGKLKVTPTVVETKIFYRDYEDFTGGNGYLNTANGTAGFGTATNSLPGGTTFNPYVGSVSGKNGKGVDFNTSTMTGSNGNPVLAFNKILNNGVLYVAFDVKLSAASESSSVTSLAESFIKLSNSNDDNVGTLVGIGTDGTLYKGGTANSAWEVNATEYKFDTTNYHKVEITYDLETKVVTYYVDGASQGSSV